MSATHIAVPTTRFPAPKTQPPSTPVKRLINTIARAIEKTKHGLRVDREIDEASSLLESVPMTTEEFGYSRNRLRNAKRYVNSGEFGAASWELGTLRKLLSARD